MDYKTWYERIMEALSVFRDTSDDIDTSDDTEDCDYGEHHDQD